MSAEVVTTRILITDRHTATCPDCGSVREVTQRQHMMLQKQGATSECSLCRSGKKVRPSDRSRRYWLSRYSDEEIAELASALTGEDVTAETVQKRWPRTILCQDVR